MAFEFVLTNPDTQDRNGVFHSPVTFEEIITMLGSHRGYTLIVDNVETGREEYHFTGRCTNLLAPFESFET